MSKDSFDRFIVCNRDIATTKGVNWDIRPNPEGVVPQGQAWPIHELCGVIRQKYWLNNFGSDKNCLKTWNDQRLKKGAGQVSLSVLSANWQDLIKAAVIDQIFIRANKAVHIALHVIRPLKVLGMCAQGTEPWQLTRETIELAHSLAKESQPSGQLANQVIAVVKNILDFHALSERYPLLQANDNAPLRPRGTGSYLRERLSERRKPEKLPEQKAFWELSRILFTEKPSSFNDELRFAQLKLLVLCGFRIGEPPLIPFNWNYSKNHLDRLGLPAGESGGVSTSIAIRYFVEKRDISLPGGSLLYIDRQEVPQIFIEIVREIFERVERLTAQLRRRLAEQVRTGRVLAGFNVDELVRVTELYTSFTGNPFVYADPKQSELIARYREDYDTTVLEEIHQRQEMLSKFNNPSPDLLRYFFELRKGYESILPFRDKDGNILKRQSTKGFFLIADVEALLEVKIPRKQANLRAIKTSIGELALNDFLFIGPKRALAEARNGSICDITKYIFTDRIETAELKACLYNGPYEKDTIFKRYGRNEVDRALTIKSHSLRHLQNTELFRMGIADTAITKRYGRASIAQSHEYDHRNLFEELDFMTPKGGEGEALDNASSVLALIRSGHIGGRIVDEFKSIQAAYGDEIAFQFLSAEADGVHATPYGFCINSFIVSPCPNHLSCFNGCKHLALDDSNEHKGNLIKIRDKMINAIELIEERPSESIGRANQLSHARAQLENIEKALNCSPGARPFPDGEDLSDIDKVDILS
ncbi:TPA: hypothetical protein ACQQQE_006348 [Pseudomonas aeruginosa]